MKQSPKHYLADPALAVYLLGLDERIISSSNGWSARTEIFDKKYGSIIGRLFESLVQLSLNTYACVNNSKLYYMRTYRGECEVDFIIQKGLKTIACEVKFAPTVNDTDGRHLRRFTGKVGSNCRDAMIITTGNIAYRRKDGIAVVPAALLGA